MIGFTFKLCSLAILASMVFAVPLQNEQQNTYIAAIKQSFNSLENQNYKFSAELRFEHGFGPIIGNVQAYKKNERKASTLEVAWPMMYSREHRVELKNYIYFLNERNQCGLMKKKSNAEDIVEEMENLLKQVDKFDIDSKQTIQTINGHDCVAVSNNNVVFWTTLDPLAAFSIQQIDINIPSHQGRIFNLKMEIADDVGSIQDDKFDFSIENCVEVTVVDDPMPSSSIGNILTAFATIAVNFDP